MGRVLKILMYLVLLFLVYLWLSTVFKSCNSESNIITEATETLEDTADDIVDASQDIAEEADEFFEDEDEDEVNYEELDAEEDWEDEDIYEEDVIETPASEPAPKPASKPTTPAPARSTSSGGNYLVIAGSYMQKENAVSMRSKLTKLGHAAEIVNFDNSNIHVVTSGRYATRSDAAAAARQLSAKGIDNYVHMRK